MTFSDRGRDITLDCDAPPSEPDWRISRIRRRTQLSIAGKVHLLLCLKYSNHPRRVRLTSSMITVRLWPLLRPVLDRMVSLSFLRLFFRGRRGPPSTRYPRKSNPCPGEA